MSVHVRGRAAESPQVAAAVSRCLDAIADDERVFSPFLPTSDISRLRRGEIIPIDPRVADVGAHCDELRDASGGRFDADHQGWFDPTGLVKGWSVERAADIHLRPLLSQAGIDAVGINAGGDVRVFTAAHAEWDWAIGIADPRRPDALCGVVHLRDGAVATSGTAERGVHLVDARTGTVRRGILGATVVAGDLLTADSWATVAAIAGIADAGWVANAPIDSALIVEGDVVRQWANGVELTAHEPVWPPLTPQGA